MKKSAVFLILSFILPGFFACQIPKAVEIIGTPSARFAETVDVGKMFVDLLKDAISANENLSIFPCENESIEIVTYLIYVDLLDEPFHVDDNNDPILPDREDDGDVYFDGTHVDFEIQEERTLIKSGANPEVIPLSELGNLLEGFKFYDGKDKDGTPLPDQEGVYKTKLYFSGSDILKDAKLEITINEINEDGSPGDPIFYIKDISVLSNESDPYHESNFKDWETAGCYEGVSCPSGGFPFDDIEINGKDIAVSYRVYFPAHTTVPITHFQDGWIKAEVVVWLPFKFIAVDEKAMISFPPGSFFSSEDDLFGREEPDSDSLIADVIESISVDVKFHNNPFMGADLIIDSDGVNIPPNRITGDTLSFTLTDDNMKEINDPDNWPFIPNIQIGYAEGETLTFPRIFNAVEFAFKAKVRYRIDF